MSMPSINSPSVVLRAALTGTTDSNGQLWFSNMVPGLYKTMVLAPPQQEIFQFLIASNYPTTIGVDSNLVSDATATFPAASVSWSASVTDLRYAKSTGNPGVLPTITTMTPTTLTQALAGYTVNNGTGMAAIALTNTLPSATVLGTWFRCVVTAGHRFAFQCQPSDVVQLDAIQSSLGGQIFDTGSTGDVITIQVVFPNVWYVIAHEGNDWSVF
jgi:hypothetical protein